MANYTSISFEAVRDTRLPATVENNVTIHRISTVRRGAPSWWQERWLRHDNSILGHGGCGLVWLEKRVKIFEAEEDKWRAVKAIRVADSKSTNEGVRYVRELEALAKFSQPKYAEFFVEFFGWYEIPNYLCIAMEYCEYGDLRKYLEVVKKMPEDQVKEVASQVLGALAMMHEAGYTHRDVKPANILIKSIPPDKWWVKVCDLGLSKRAEDIAGAPTTVRGTPGFLAPETLDCDPSTGQRGSFPIDMWCFGETVYQMLTGEPVFKSYTALFHYRAGSIEFPDQAFERVNASPEARHFVRSLMLAHPQLRRTATAHPVYGARGHPWMARSPMQQPSVHHQSPVVNNTTTEWPPPLPQDGDQLTGVSGKWTQTIEIAQHLAEQVAGSLGGQNNAYLPSTYPAIPGPGYPQYPYLPYVYSTPSPSVSQYYNFLSSNDYYAVQYLNAMMNSISGGSYYLPAIPLGATVLPKRSSRNIARSKPPEIVKREFKEAITKAASKLSDSSPQPKDANLDSEESTNEQTHPKHQQSDLSAKAQTPVSKGKKSWKKSREEMLRKEKLAEFRKFAETFKLKTPVPAEVAELFSREKPLKSNSEGSSLAGEQNLLHDQTDESWTVVTSRRKHSGPTKRGRRTPDSPPPHTKALSVREITLTPRPTVTTRAFPALKHEFAAHQPAPRLPKPSPGRQSWAEVAATEGGEPTGQSVPKKPSFQEEIAIW